MNAPPPPSSSASGNRGGGPNRKRSRGRRRLVFAAAAHRALPLSTAFLLGCAVCTTVLLHWTSPHRHHRGDDWNFGVGVGPTNRISSPSATATRGGGRPASPLPRVAAASSSSATSSSSTTRRPSPSSILNGMKVLVAIASYDFSQLPHLEEVLDSYHDLCAAGSHVTVVVHTTEPYPVPLIDLLNSRLRCDNPSPESGLEVVVTLKSPSLRLNLVDCHRALFYDKIDEYDLFIYAEDDIRVTPKTIATYLVETSRVLDLSGGNELEASNYNVGIVRYEYNYPPEVIIDDKTRHATRNVTRVYWEHGSKPIVPKAMDAAPATRNAELSKRYVHMLNHHQGMFLATRSLLKAWRTRPNCQFDVVRRRPGLRNNPSQPSEGTQRVWMSSNMLFGKKHCNVQQLLPIDNFGSLNVLHLPNKNYRRVGKKGRLGGAAAGEKAPPVEFGDGKESFAGADPSLLTAMQVNNELRRKFPRERPSIPYRGPVIMVDEIDRSKHFKGREEHAKLVHRRMRSYREYEARGGIMIESDMADAI